MALTAPQLATLKAAILADGTLNAFPNNSDGNYDLANTGLKAVAAGPNNICWKSAVQPAEYRNQIVWSEIAALTAGNSRVWEYITGMNTLPINAADANIRSAISAAFTSGAPNTLTVLTAIAKRIMTKLESFFATGTGSTASPATLVIEGGISAADVAAVRNS